MVEEGSLKATVAAILPCIHKHSKTRDGPFVLGLSGLQGSGKSTWAEALRKHLEQHCSLQAKVISLDDLYLDRHELLRVLDGPGSKILRTRGLPGTHDQALAVSFFNAVLNTRYDGSERNVRWPAYDKSLYDGQGGRAAIDTWETVSLDRELDVLIFEGWCLGFQSLADKEVERLWRADALMQSESTEASSQLQPLTQSLHFHTLEDLLLVNETLRQYCDKFMGSWRFHSFIHLSTDTLENVYRWRLDQERALAETGRSAMTAEQVGEFVRGYMPAYNLYLDKLERESLFGPRDINSIHDDKKHVQIILDGQRRVLRVREVVRP